MAASLSSRWWGSRQPGYGYLQSATTILDDFSKLKNSGLDDIFTVFDMVAGLRRHEECSNKGRRVSQARSR